MSHLELLMKPIQESETRHEHAAAATGPAPTGGAR